MNRKTIAICFLLILAILIRVSPVKDKKKVAFSPAFTLI
jgi:hypothetical protein